MQIRKAAYALFTISFCSAFGQGTPKITMVKVESRAVPGTVPLTAELLSFLQTNIEARVPGYVERVLVDRGSVVRRGQLLVQLSAPEMTSQTNSAEATLHQAEADLSEAQSLSAATTSTYDKLADAAKTPGAVAGNELVQAQKQKDASEALVLSRKAAMESASSRLKATGEMQLYLRVVAPFDGIITDRFVHPGMMIGTGGQAPLLKLQQVAQLRLVVPVPEKYVSSVSLRKVVSFHVPAYPGKTFTGSVARTPQALDATSRSMMVELDVANPRGELAPGMYPTVDWPISSSGELLVVPSSSVVTTTARVFVIKSQNGHAHWVDVKKGAAYGDQVAIRGNIGPGDVVVKSATDEIREGQPLRE